MDYAQPEHREATLLERLVAAGIDPTRARDLITAGAVRVEGADGPVTDPEASTPRPRRWHFGPS